MDRFDKFTDRARKVLTLAQDEAQRFNHNYIGTEHLLLGLVREGEGVAARVLENMNVELPKVRTAVEFIIGRGDRPVVGEVGLTPRAKRVIELAIDEARRLGHNYIGTEHLLLGLVREGEGIAAGVLESLGVNLDKVRHEVIRVLSQSLVGRSRARRPSAPARPRPSTSSGINLTEAARAGKLDPVIGREKEIERVIQILSRRTKNNPALIGEPGVGKTAIAEGLAQRIVTGDVPGDAAEQARPDARHRLARGRHQVPRRVRGAAQEDHRGAAQHQRRGPVHRRAPHARRARARPRARSTRPTSSSRRSPAASCSASAPRRSTSTASTSSATRPSSAASSRSWSRSRRSSRRSRSSRASASATSSTTRSRSPTTRVKAAADLSIRYITDRHLPDKAIDLIDEAASRVRLRYASAPPALREAQKELDRVTREKDSAINAQEYEEAATLRESEATAARARRRPPRPSGRRRSPASSRRSTKRRSPRSWRCGPASRSRASPRRSPSDCSTWKTTLHKRVIGQQEAIEIVSQGRPPGPGRPEGSQAPDRLVHLPRPHRRRQDRAGQGRSPSSCSAARTRSSRST